MNSKCYKCGECLNCNCPPSPWPSNWRGQPTELTSEDIDNFFEMLMTYEIKQAQCFKCGKDYFPNYGGHLQECDTCYFARFPKDQVEAFYRSFLE